MIDTKTLDALVGTRNRFTDALKKDKEEKNLEASEVAAFQKMIAILDALINAYSS